MKSNMSHRLEKELANIRRRASTLIVLYAAGWIVASFVSVIFFCALTDNLIHFNDPGIRVIASLLTLVTLLGATYHFFFIPWAHRPSDVGIAQRIEGRFPQLGDRFSSAIGFLSQAEDDVAAGSAALRRAVITETTGQIERLDLTSVLNRRPVVGALLAALVISMTAGLIAARDTPSARIALVRLAHPLGSTAWPRKHHLVFRKAPTHLARGDPFEVELVDANGKLPELVRIHFRFEVDGQFTEEVSPMQSLDDVVIARRESVHRTFEYRAEGGDDDSMPWRRLHVFVPPRVESFQVTLFPPAYTGWGPTKSDKRIRALRGTQVQIDGRATKPLRRAKLILENGHEVDARLSDDGRRFTVPANDLTVDESTNYRFALEDHEELLGGGDDHWQIVAVSDSPPSVQIEQPETDSFVTPGSTVPLRIVVKDNLAIRDVAIVYSRSDQSDRGDWVLPLYSGPDQVESVQDVATSRWGTGGADRKIVTHPWDLAGLGMMPGSSIVLHAQAHDYLPQLGQTASPRRITIITSAELEDRISEQQRGILSELARALQLQRNVRNHSAGLRNQFQDGEQLDTRQIDQLQVAELNQREIRIVLSGNPDGAAQHARRLLADLTNHKIDNPQMIQHIERLLGEVERLSRENLPIIRRELTAALKAAQALRKEPRRPSEKNLVSRSLAEAVGQQDHVIDSLERLVDGLSQSVGYLRFASEIRKLQHQQAAVEQSTKELAPKTLTFLLKDLDKSLRARLDELAQQQLQLSQRLARVQQRMETMSAQLTDKDPLASNTLADAVETAQRLEVTAQMRDVGDNIQQNQVGQAVQRQRQIGDHLSEILRILAHRTDRGRARRINQLAEAESDLRQLRQVQTELRQQLDAAQKGTQSDLHRQELDRLRQKQLELRQDIEELAQRLERLQANDASRSTRRASEQLASSCAACRQGNTRKATESAEAAEKNLQDAQRELSDSLRHAKEDLARKLLTQFDDIVGGMMARQQHLVDETTRLEALRIQRQRRTRGQSQSVRNLARHQELLSDETLRLADSMSAVRVFQWTLGQAAQEMSHASQLLTKLETGQLTQQAAANAHSLLAGLIEARRQDSDPRSSTPQGKRNGKRRAEQREGEGKERRERGDQRRDPAVVELKLLQWTQKAINRKSQALADALSQASPVTDNLQLEMDRLARQQGELADLLHELLEPVEHDSDHSTNDAQHVDETDLEPWIPFDLEND